MQDERSKFIYKFLNGLNVERFFDSFVNINSVKQLNYQIRLLITNDIQPFLDKKIAEWRTASQYDIGKQMPNVILALDQLMSFIDEQICDIKAMERVTFGSIGNEYAYNAFMTLIFQKQFLEKLEVPLVRLIKYHFVLYSKEKREQNLNRNFYTYRGKISEMLETLYNIDFLTDYMRSCVILAIKHIVSKAVIEETSVPVTKINFFDFSKKIAFIRTWVTDSPVEIPDSDEAIRKYAMCAFISRLCDFSFEIFIENYPDTAKLIEQMQSRMIKYDWHGREKLLQTLCDSIKSRLLHVGVNTKEILKAYARSVESLIAFDVSFVLVHKVCDLIKKYVKTRSDTVQKIIHFITAEKPGESSNNFAQLVDRENLVNVNDEYVIMLEDGAESDRWEKWQPDPYDANPTESRLFRESADVFNMLVSIYDCRDLFVKEYQHLLANNLIVNGWGKQMDAESKYLEHMKKRFTDGELNQCEVMLKDIRDSSKLYNNAVFDGMHLPFFPRVLSYVFWPELKKDLKFEVIEPFASYYQQYLKAFEKKRQSRTINWYKDYGSCVKMDVKLGDCTLDVEVPLSYAQVLIPFLQKERINMNELLGQLGMDKNVLMKRLEWWEDKGILCESADDKEVWTISQNSSRMENATKQSMIRVTTEDAKDSEEEEETEISVEEQADALEQYWLYTKNLLLYHSTKDPLTPQKLANMYKMFSSPGKPAPTVDAVLLFMQRKIKQNLVIFENGAYKPDKELKSVFVG